MTIRVTQGDVNTLIVARLTDYSNGNRPLDVSSTTVYLHISSAETNELATTLTGTLLGGMPLDDGNLDTSYTTPGIGGRVQFRLVPSFTSLDIGRYYGEIEVSWASGDNITVLDKLKFNLEAQSA